MTNIEYEQTSAAIALAIWEISTSNGAQLPRDMWDEHMQNCHAAVANAYVENINAADWQANALAAVTVKRMMHDARERL